MRIGLQVPRFTWPDAPGSIGPKLAEIGRTADEAGFASLWVMDHFFQIGVVGEVDEPMLEGYGALNFLAGITDRVKLGTLVTGVHYRYPGILLKTVTTLDVLSGGRAYLGIGAGWNERESRGLGVPFPATAERFDVERAAGCSVADLFVSDGYGNSRVHKFDPKGRHLVSWGEPGTGPARAKLALQGVTLHVAAGTTVAPQARAKSLHLEGSRLPTLPVASVGVVLAAAGDVLLVAGALDAHADFPDAPPGHPRAAADTRAIVPGRRIECFSPPPGVSLNSWTPGRKRRCHRHRTGPHPSGL